MGSAQSIDGGVLDKQWEPLASMSKERFSAAYAVIDDDRFIIVGGGTYMDSGEVYNRLSDTWEKLPDWLTSHHQVGFALASMDGKLYAISGNGGYCNILDTSTFKNCGWFPPMKRPRQGCAIVALGRHIYVFGGSEDHSSERYDVDNNEWQYLPASSQCRRYCSAVAVENKIYVIGGVDCDDNHELGVVEVFNTDKQQWEISSSVSNMVMARSHSAVVAIGRFIVVMGGQHRHTLLSSIEILDTSTGDWTVLPDQMSTARSGHNAVVLGDSIIICGGYDGKDYLTSVEHIQVTEYLATVIPGLNDTFYLASDIHSISSEESSLSLSHHDNGSSLTHTNENHNNKCTTIQNAHPRETMKTQVAQVTWKTVSPMSIRRMSMKCITHDPNGFMVVGGRNNDCLGDIPFGEVYNCISNTWEKLPRSIFTNPKGSYTVVSSQGKEACIYFLSRSWGDCKAFNTSTLEWKQFPSMKRVRHSYSAVALGRSIYVFGGGGHFDGRYCAERFNLDTYQWEYLPPMSSNRSFCVAVAVQNKIYIMGGVAGMYPHHKYSDIVEVFDVVNQRWESDLSVADMVMARSDFAAVAVGRFIVIIGGMLHGKALSSADVLDTSTGKWTVLPDRLSIQTARFGHDAIVVGDSIYITGGHNGTHHLNSTESIPIASLEPYLVTKPLADYKEKNQSRTTKTMSNDSFVTWEEMENEMEANAEVRKSKCIAKSNKMSTNFANTKRSVLHQPAQPGIISSLEAKKGSVSPIKKTSTTFAITKGPPCTMHQPVQQGAVSTQAIKTSASERIVTNSTTTKHQFSSLNVNNSDKGEIIVGPKNCTVMVSFNTETAGYDAEALTEFLNAKGLRTFCTIVYCKYHPGDWRDTVTEASATCKVYVPLMTNGWQQSKECQRETKIVKNRLVEDEVTIIPVWYKDVDCDLDFDYKFDQQKGHYYKHDWSSLQAMNRSNPSWKDGIARLIEQYK